MRDLEEDIIPATLALFFVGERDENI